MFNLGLLIEMDREELLFNDRIGSKYDVEKVNNEWKEKNKLKKLADWECCTKKFYENYVEERPIRPGLLNVDITEDEAQDIDAFRRRRNKKTLLS